MAYNYVTFPSIEPSSINWGVQGLSGVFTGPAGITQGVERPMLWKATLSFEDLDESDSQDLETFLYQMAASPNNVFLLTDNSYVARGSLAGAPKINGAGQSGKSLNTKGWTPSATGVLMPGDYFVIDTLQMFRALAQVDADISGNATIALAVSMRSSPTDSSDITVSSPSVTMRLPQFGYSGDFKPPILGSFSFDVIEVVV